MRGKIMFNFIIAFTVTGVIVVVIAAVVYFIGELSGVHRSPQDVFICAALSLLFLGYPTLMAFVASGTKKSNDKKSGTTTPL
jgi:hypothetical protein